MKKKEKNEFNYLQKYHVKKEEKIKKEKYRMYYKYIIN